MSLSNLCRASSRSWIAAGLAALAAVASAHGARAQAQNYEIWALDQGTHIVHIFNPALQEVAKIDLGARGVRVPHMIDFTSDGAYAFIASPSSGDVTVIRTRDRAILSVLKTGPGTHAATVKPDDGAVLVDVIGDAAVARDGKLVEIRIDRRNEAFLLARELVIANDPLFRQNADKFKDVGAICHDTSADGRHAYVTLGPVLADGGLVVVDTVDMKLVAAFPPDQLKVNCGTALSRDGKRMFLNGGGADTGIWYVIDTATLKVTHEASSRGFDAHGVWPIPDGKEVWMVNRATSNGIVIDANTLAVLAEIKDFGTTPDILAISPDSRFAYITTRGPNPVTAAHIAKGKISGFAVMSVPDRRFVRQVEPAPGNERSDFHGIGIRVPPN